MLAGVSPEKKEDEQISRKYDFTQSKWKTSVCEGKGKCDKGHQICSTLLERKRPVWFSCKK